MDRETKKKEKLCGQGRLGSEIKHRYRSIVFSASFSVALSISNVHVVKG